jgi:ribosome-binding protein aMBF1 (putative translation factor)
MLSDVAGKSKKLSDQLRRAIESSGMSRYAIAKAIGLDQSVLSRFMAGTSGLSVQNLDRLGMLLKLKIVAEDETEKTKGP